MLKSAKGNLKYPSLTELVGYALSLPHSKHIQRDTSASCEESKQIAGAGKKKTSSVSIRHTKKELAQFSQLQRRFPTPNILTFYVKPYVRF